MAVVRLRRWEPKYSFEAWPLEFRVQRPLWKSGEPCTSRSASIVTNQPLRCWKGIGHEGECEFRPSLMDTSGWQ